MSINHLPNEILVQILDDYSLELEDLALLSRVSRHWHGAILPALYKSYTLRFHPWLEPDDERKLESFMKYGNYVKNLYIFPTCWNDTVISPDGQIIVNPDLTRLLQIIRCFTEATEIEYYNSMSCNLTWAGFFSILNSLLTGRPRLESLTVWRIRPLMFPTDEEPPLIAFPPAPPLPNLRRFHLYIGPKNVSKREVESQSVRNFNVIIDCIAMAIGESCCNVADFSFISNGFGKPTKDFSPPQIGEYPQLQMGNITKLSCDVFNGYMPPPLFIGLGSSKPTTLSTSYWACRNWIKWALGQMNPEIHMATFERIETLYLRYQNKDWSDNIEDDLGVIIQHLPSLKLLIMDDDRFSVFTNPDGVLKCERIATARDRD